jgi:hypothetical protein
MNECVVAIKPLIRYSAPPTRYDYAAYGTLCSALKNDDGSQQELFVQVSKDEHDPHWIAVSELIHKVFEPQFTDHCFIKDCLERYENIDPLKKIPTQ